MTAKILCLTILLGLTFQVQAEVVAGEDAYAHPRVDSEGTNFTAADYFAPIREGEDRSKLPNKLTLITQESVSTEQLKEMILKSEWRLVFHCDGQAIPVDKFKRTGWQDGEINSFTTVGYFYRDGKIIFNQKLHPPVVNPKNFKKSIESGELTLLENLGGGEFRVKFSGFSTDKYKIVWAQETNEILLDLDRVLKEVTENNKICPDKKAPQRLLVPINDDLIS